MPKETIKEQINTSSRMYGRKDSIDAFAKSGFNIIPLKTYKFIESEED